MVTELQFCENIDMLWKTYKDIYKVTKKYFQEFKVIF